MLIKAVTYSRPFRVMPAMITQELHVPDINPAANQNRRLIIRIRPHPHLDPNDAHNPADLRARERHQQPEPMRN